MTIWISHRGYTKKATENTVNAFDDAIALGFAHLETDLRTSRDGHIVLCHDPDVSRISTHQGKVNELTRRELEAIKLNQGEPLLFFEEFIQRYKHLNWTLDIKPDSAEQTLYALREWLQEPTAEAFLRQQVRFLMWQPAHEEQIGEFIDNAFCLAGDKACVKAGIAALTGFTGLGVKPKQTYAVPPKIGRIPILNKALVKRYHKQQARVLGYLPETRSEHEQVLRAGVDEILTNHADLLQALS